MSRITWPIVTAGLVVLVVYVQFFPRPIRSQAQDTERNPQRIVDASAPPRNGQAPRSQTSPRETVTQSNFQPVEETPRKGLESVEQKVIEIEKRLLQGLKAATSATTAAKDTENDLPPPPPTPTAPPGTVPVPTVPPPTVPPPSTSSEIPAPTPTAPPKVTPATSKDESTPPPPTNPLETPPAPKPGSGLLDRFEGVAPPPVQAPLQFGPAPLTRQPSPADVPTVPPPAGTTGGTNPPPPTLGTTTPPPPTSVVPPPPPLGATQPPLPTAGTPIPPEPVVPARAVVPPPPVPEHPMVKANTEIKITSPWTFHLEIIEGKNIITAKVGRTIQFKVTCDKCDMQSPHGNIQAAGNVRIHSIGLEAVTEKMTINLQEDSMVLEGKAQLKCLRDDQEMELRSDRFSLRLSEIQNPVTGASGTQRPPSIRFSRETGN